MRRAATIFTGFLGSGKTTLLNRLLLREEFSRAAVLVNEFGAVGLDHDLLRFASERVAVLSGGCICCTVREDIEEAVRHLFEQQAAGNIADFDQLLIETTGVADPVPLLHTFKSSSLLSSNFELRRVVTTIDAALGEQTLTRFAEANKQVALADTILITKTDLLADEEVLVKLKNDIKRVNPWASIATGNLTEVAGLEESWIPSLLESVPESDGAIPEHGSLVHVSGDRPVASFSLSWSESLDWTAFGVWLTLLLHRHGQNVLRIKGLLNVKQAQGPVVFHCVQHIVHPPVHLDSWPTEDHTSRMTFILKGIDIAVIRRSLAAFNKLMNIRGSETLMHKGVGAGSTVRGRPVRRPSAPRWVK